MRHALGMSITVQKYAVFRKTRVDRYIGVSIFESKFSLYVVYILDIFICTCCDPKKEAER